MLTTVPRLPQARAAWPNALLICLLDYLTDWDAAIAAWVRASLAPDRAATLRADLDRLVTDALIPERARTRPARERETAADELRLEWERVKTEWSATVP